jgi:transcription initiation factor TFIIIB Brf1 subunit/transcription initiation factor TFIIB
MKRALGMKYCETQTMMGTGCMLLTTPEICFLDLCKKENSPQNIIDIGKKITKKIEKNPLFQSGNPVNIGGAIFYIASVMGGVKITQKYVCDKINTTEVTIRAVFHKILKSDKILAENFKNINKKEKHGKLSW